MKLRVEVDRCKSEELCVLDVDRDLLGNNARVVGPEPDIPGVILDGPKHLEHMATDDFNDPRTHCA